MATGVAVPPTPASFKYMFIPMEGDMAELDWSEKVTLEEDSFNKHVKNWFAQLNSGEVDQEMLRQQIKAHAAQSKQQMPDLDDQMMGRLLSHQSCDIFPIQVPMKDSGFESVSLYCDDKGIAKGLEANARATGLVRACGYNDQTIRGDCFISRIFDDEDAWLRIDFGLADMNSSAPWVETTKRMKAKGSGSGGGSSLSALTSQMNNPAVVAPGVGQNVELDNAEKSAESGLYRWKQESDEVEVTGPVPAGTVRKDLKVDTQALSVRVYVKGELLFGGKTFGPIDADDSTWTLGSDDKGPHIQLTLSKAREMKWDSVFTDGKT